MRLTPEQWSLVVEHRHEVVNVARRYWRGNGDWDDVEDAAMWGLIRAAARYRPAKGDFGVYARTMMEGAARWCAFRPRRATPSPLSWVADDGRRSRSNSHCLADLEGHWACLTPKQRRIAGLRYQRGLSITRIAEEVGVGRSGVTTKLGEIAERLRRSVHGLPMRSPAGGQEKGSGDMNPQEPSGFVSGTVQYVIRFLPGHGHGRGDYLASHGPHVPDPATARKFATVADAVCHVETVCKPDFLHAWVAHQPGRVPTGRFVVVPELDPERVVWPASNAGGA